MIKAFAIQYTTFNQAKTAEIIAYSVNARHAAHSIRGKGKIITTSSEPHGDTALLIKQRKGW